MDELKDLIKNSLADRLQSPLYGYISFSWLACNWSNVAYLLMSKVRVEDRINAILNQPNLWWNYFVVPIIVGSSLAIFSPYFRSWLLHLHAGAVAKEYDVRIQQAAKKVALDNAEKLAQEQENTRFLIEKEKQKRELIITEDEQKKADSLKEQVEQLLKNAESARREMQESREYAEYWRNQSIKILTMLRDFTNLSDAHSVQTLKNEINNIFTFQDIQLALSDLNEVDKQKKEHSFKERFFSERS
ncbi:hypothetical protein [Cronobacter dublinensis]|uniref:hypothetical protein n=1 Tax=Cronobacter dublinensis TaxID=413497 RepID=UPI000CFCC39B|nr:hypothetical protein [Cronobacter dublinensis]